MCCSKPEVKVFLLTSLVEQDVARWGAVVMSAVMSIFAERFYCAADLSLCYICRLLVLRPLIEGVGGFRPESMLACLCPATLLSKLLASMPGDACLAEYRPPPPSSGICSWLPVSDCYS